jgi:hypothetical protein
MSTGLRLVAPPSRLEAWERTGLPEPQAPGLKPCLTLKRILPGGQSAANCARKRLE